jgi:hypothetical protein
MIGRSGRNLDYTSKKQQQMTTIQLKEFVKTGKFGTIGIGSTKSDVIDLLGEDFDFGDFGDSQIIKYGWYEFFYWTNTGKLFGIQNDHLVANCTNHDELILFENGLWKLDKWFLRENENFTFKQVMEILEQERIPFVIEPVYPGCDENLIKCTESNVKFDFTMGYSYTEMDERGNFNGWVEVMLAEKEEDAVLNGIRLFERL